MNSKHLAQPQEQVKWTSNSLDSCFPIDELLVLSLNINIIQFILSTCALLPFLGMTLKKYGPFCICVNF